MTPPQDTSRHTCHHCETEVLTIKGCKPIWDPDNPEKPPKWRLPLKHSPDGVHEAARSGCPFFARLWEDLFQYCSTHGLLEELGGTRLSFEFQASKLEQTPAVDSKSACDDLLLPTHNGVGQELYDITECNIISWTPGGSERIARRFTAVSDWGMEVLGLVPSALIILLSYPLRCLHKVPDDPSANHAIARLIDGHTSSNQAIDQIRRRLQYCLAHHDKCKAAFSGIRPRRFLSVGDSANPTVKVIRAENLSNRDSEPYAALSYCWGQNQEFKLTSANKIDMEDGLPLNLIPKTITDAIRVTRELGIKLFWVDSLCLVQDEEEELAKEIARMHHYFGNAYITISAAAAASCTEGFLQDNPAPPKSGALTSYEIIFHDALEPYDIFHLPVDLGVQERPSYLKLVHFWHGYEKQLINYRAWTLQEGLLSHRLVSFSSRVVSWSCRTETWALPDDNGQQDLYHRLVAVCGAMGQLSERELALSRLWAWCDVVDNYTSRHLSHDRDKLTGISGIASVLSAPARDVAQAEYQLGFMAGLLVHYPLAHPPIVVDSLTPEVKYHPQDHFESFLFAIQLLWQDDSWARDIFGHQDWAKLERQKRERQESQPSPYIAPTWSWASHLGSANAHTPFHDVAEMMNTEQFDLLSRKFWEQEFRIREVCVTLSSSEAPLGALTGGSLTLDGHIFRPDEEKDRIQQVDFDDGRMKVDPGDCRGLFCLQIVPKDQELEWMNALGGHDLRQGLQGIVLERIKPEGRFRNDERLYRRVGIYLNRYTLYYDTSKKLSGTVERIKII